MPDHSNHTNHTTNKTGTSPGLAFVVGGLVIVVGIIAWLMFAGDVDTTDDVNVTIEGTAESVEGAADSVEGAVEGAAESVEDAATDNN